MAVEKLSGRAGVRAMSTKGPGLGRSLGLGGRDLGPVVIR